MYSTSYLLDSFNHPLTAVMLCSRTPYQNRSLSYMRKLTITPLSTWVVMIDRWRFHYWDSNLWSCELLCIVTIVYNAAIFHWKYTKWVLQIKLAARPFQICYLSVLEKAADTTSTLLSIQYPSHEWDLILGPLHLLYHDTAVRAAAWGCGKYFIGSEATVWY